MTMASGVSVVLCCYNSAIKLGRTLESIALLKDSVPGAIELILVDNNSSDNTASVASSLWQDLLSPFPLIIVTEYRQGLSAARKAGVMRAKYDAIILCDDDNELFPDYATVAWEMLNSNECIGALGGLGIARIDGLLPEWWEVFAKSYAVGPQAEYSGPVSSARNYVYGAGMVVRKNLLVRLYELEFDSILSDRKGQALSSGGDVELCYLLRLAGYQIWFEERLKFYHRIDPDRLTWDYYLKLKRGITDSFPVMFVYRYYLEVKSDRVSDFLIYYFQKVRSLVRGRFKSDTNYYRKTINRLQASMGLQFLVLHPLLILRLRREIGKRVSLVSTAFQIPR